VTADPREDLPGRAGAARLAAIVRAALHDPSASVLAWRRETLRASLGAATGGAHLFSGTARCRAGDLPWKAVRKLLRPPRGTRHDRGARDPAHFAYWRREALAYDSGLLAGLPDGLAAPRCLGVEDADAPDARDAGSGPAGQHGEAVWLWLEAVTDRYGGWWPAERTLLAARHLGAFGGAYAAGRRALPAAPWLGGGYLRQRIESAPAVLPLFEDGPAWNHPLLRGRFAPDAAGRLRSPRSLTGAGCVGRPTASEADADYPPGSFRLPAD
jgi:hypothetical protein